MDNGDNMPMASAAATVVLIAMAVQLLLDPGESAWGFYEQAGFAVAGVLLLIAGIRTVHRWWSRPRPE